MSWEGVKKQTNFANIEAWCDEMSIKNYTINSKGEIDVDGNVDLNGIDIKELPYKFGKVIGFFSVYECNNLTSLKNCPDYVRYNFSCTYCRSVNSLEGCPKEVGGDFWCRHCKRKFTEKEVMSLCNVKMRIYN